MIDPKLRGREHHGTFFLPCPEQTHRVCRRKTMLSTAVIIALVQSLSYIVSWWNYKLRNPIISRNERLNTVWRITWQFSEGLAGSAGLAETRGGSVVTQKQGRKTCLQGTASILIEKFLHTSIRTYICCASVGGRGSDMLVYTIVYTCVCFPMEAWD